MFLNRNILEAAVARVYSFFLKFTLTSFLWWFWLKKTPKLILCACVCVCVCVCVCKLSHVGLVATLWTVAPQASQSMGYSRQKYQSGLPCPPLRDLPNPGTESMSLVSPALAGGFFTTVPSGKLTLCTPI